MHRHRLRPRLKLRALAAALSFALLGGCFSKHAYPDGSGLEGQLEREVLALRAQLYRQEAGGACGQGPDAVYGELHQVLQPNDATVKYVGPVTQVILQESELFGADGTSIRQEARMALDMVATALNSHPRHRVFIEGHTADVAPTVALTRAYPNLWDLGYVRASAVANVLINDFKVNPVRFTVATRGSSAPLASNDTASGQSRNRRVVIAILPPGVSP